MANYVDKLVGHEVEVRIGDGGQPEVFAHSLLINAARSVDFSVSTEDTELPDLDDLSALSQMTREAKSTDVSISGSGIVHKASVGEYLEWTQTGEAKNVEVRLATKLMTGRFILSQFKVGGDLKAATECEITLVQAGAISVVDAA